MALKVLFSAAEAAPIVKVGGLGDVAGSLPKALEKLGVDISLALPKYAESKLPGDTKKAEEFEVSFGKEKTKVELLRGTLPGSQVPVFLFQNEHFFEKGEHKPFSGTATEVDRFAFFSVALSDWITSGKGKFDLLHLNDWHTSLVPLLLRQRLGKDRPATLLTIHNFFFQGFALVDLVEKIGVTLEDCRILAWDAADGNLDILLEGIAHADVINTVSPTYAREIMTAEYGRGLDKVLQARGARVFGILNGIDYSVFNPETDDKIFAKYGPKNWPEGKSKNKLGLQKELGLAESVEIPLIGFVGRLDGRQKGIDLIEAAMRQLLAKENFQFVILGTGDRELEERLPQLAGHFKDKMRAEIRFDTTLAAKIYAGADIVLVPSRFEPCGLPQMIAMKYGALPLVRRTGGLADTVKDGETGFVFEEYRPDALAYAIKQAIGLFGQKDEWAKMVKQALSQDFSWRQSAQEYVKLYEKAVEYRRG